MSSTSFSMRTLANEPMALATLVKSGAGRPLQRFERVQDAFLTNEDPGCALSRIEAIGSIAPSAITRSLILELSPAMFPSPQMACSITSTCGDLSSSTRALMVPLSISIWTYSLFPLAKLVKHHAASNYRKNRDYYNPA